MELVGLQRLAAIHERKCCLRSRARRTFLNIVAKGVSRLLCEVAVSVSERAVTNLLDRYDELLAVALADDRRLKRVLTAQGPTTGGRRWRRRG